MRRLIADQRNAKQRPPVVIESPDLGARHRKPAPRARKEALDHPALILESATLRQLNLRPSYADNHHRKVGRLA